MKDGESVWPVFCILQSLQFNLLCPLVLHCLLLCCVPSVPLPLLMLSLSLKPSSLPPSLCPTFCFPFTALKDAAEMTRFPPERPSLIPQTSAFLLCSRMIVPSFIKLPGILCCFALLFLGFTLPGLKPEARTQWGGHSGCIWSGLC